MQAAVYQVAHKRVLAFLEVNGRNMLLKSASYQLLIPLDRIDAVEYTAIFLPARLWAGLAFIACALALYFLKYPPDYFGPAASLGFILILAYLFPKRVLLIHVGPHTWIIEGKVKPVFDHLCYVLGTGRS